MPLDFQGGQLELIPATTPLRRTPPLVLLAQTESEHELQIACTKMLLSIKYSDVCFTAIDHAHSLNKTIGRHGVPIGMLEARKRKLRGVRTGIADYLFWHRGNAFAIELKTVDGILSDDQRDFLKELIVADVEVSVCWTQKQVLERASAWGLCRRISA